MAKAGDSFEMPDGSSYIVGTPAAETSGEYVEMEFVLPPDCLPPPPHIHPAQVEEYEVIEGRLGVIVEGEKQTIGPGQSASVPIGALHTFSNDTDGTIRVRNWHRPAKEFEEYIERINRALGELGAKSVRDPRVLMVLSGLMFEYSDTLYPGRRRERIPMRVMARLGRLLRLPSGD